MPKEIKITKMYDDVITPTYGTKGAACFDIYANWGQGVDSAISAGMAYGNTLMVGTGLKLEVPEGHVLEIHSRSGQGFKDDIRLANCTGIIDSDYRGELLVKLTRDNSITFTVNKGDRIAQGKFVPIEQVTFKEVKELSTTERGEGGGGSTGK